MDSILILRKISKMSFIHLITWFSLLLAVSAQTATATTNSKATSTTSTGIATWTIKVGHRSDPHQYVPHSLKASVGDIVVFEFYPRNHSVVEADYDVPCQPAHKPSIFTSGHFNSFNEQNGQLIGPVCVELNHETLAPILTQLSHQHGHWS
jgi:plastocyanin